MRVYELAKKLGKSSKDILEVAKKIGIKLSNHMSALDSAAKASIEKSLCEKKVVSSKAEDKKEDKKIVQVVKKKAVVEVAKKNQDVVSKKSATREVTIQKQDFKKKLVTKNKNQQKNKFPVRDSGFSRSHFKEKTVNEVLEALESAVLNLEKSYTVAELSKILGVNEIAMVGLLVSMDKFYSVNAVIPSKEISSLFDHFNIKIVQAEKEESEQNKDLEFKLRKSSDQGELRNPVVTIMGHVDHGKTTLIDFIRKTSIAKKEAGGITQCVSAYNIQTSHGKFTLIDTPGHEAFFSMRDKGSKITDLAVIVIAADDGVMPQTVESIKLAKDIGANLIVAFNKMDKPGVELNLDKIKEKLSQYDVLTEDWGGDVVCVPISAKTGKGVKDLLEMLSLQAEMLELRAKTDVPAKAFVLESQVEKGVGPTATVIVQEGILKFKDDFYISSNKGRVKALFEDTGKKINQAGPSQAVKVVGLSSVAKPGDMLCQGNQPEFEEVVVDQDSNKNSDFAKHSDADNSLRLNVILKADGFGGLEALKKTFDIMAKKNASVGEIVNIISGSVGDISEGDVLLAENTGSIILGLGCKVNKEVQVLAKQKNVEMVLNKILYRISEYVEKVAIDRLKDLKELKKIGSGTVKKVFNFGSRGFVAGCQVDQGKFVENSIVHVFRNNEKVGQSIVKSLQRNKLQAKEVEQGDDCGLTAPEIKSWQEGDLVECFVEVAKHKF